jgi:hypothetical protein
VSRRETLNTRLARALRYCRDWGDAGRRFERTVTDAEIESARPFVFALAYRLLEDRDDERRELAGSAFGTAWRLDGQEFPPPLSDVNDSILETWAGYVVNSKNQVALSRFHDLLWERRYGERHVHARAAAHAYLALASGNWAPVHRCQCAMRALELARSISDAPLAERAIDGCETLTHEDLRDEEWTPGVAMRLIETLAALPPELRPASTPGLIEQADSRYGRDPFIAESVAELRAAVSSPEQRERVWRDQVQAWRKAANAAGGFTAYARRQRALELALNRGLGDLADAIRVDLQSTSPDELEFQEISSEVVFTADEIEAYLASATAGDTWQEALARFGRFGPPTGDVDANAAAVDSLAESSVARWISQREVIGPYQARVFRTVSEQDHARLERVQQEGLGLLIFAPLAVQALERITHRFGIPDARVLAEHLASGPIDAGLSRRLASAVGYYWRGEYDAAGHLLAPRIETAIRHLCALAGLPVIKPPRGSEPGGVVSLGVLLESLRGHMDESWRRYLAHLLADPLALNLRNDIAHGLIPAVDQNAAALLVHALCHIAALEVTPRS